MKILFISPSIPNRLNRIRAYQLIKYLSVKNQIYLLSLIPPNQEEAEIEDISKFCVGVSTVRQTWFSSLGHCFLSIFSPTPLEVAFCANSAMKKLAKRIIKKFSPDLIYVKRLRSAQYVWDILDIPIVLDTTDAMSLFYKRALKTVSFYKKLLFFEEWLRYLIYEKRAFKKFKTWLVSSPLDQKYLMSFNRKDWSAYIIPNGVDLDYYKSVNVEAEENAIIFSGLMNKHVNTSAILYFVKEIFPKIKRKIPKVKLYIAGPKPGRIIKRLHDGESIIVKGYVDDLRIYIQKARVVVCPILTGAGTRNKILQAWALNRPVVSTAIGASGLEFSENQDILIADDSETFSANVVKLLQDKNLWDKMVRSGRDRVKKKYDMVKITADLESTLRAKFDLWHK